MATLSRSIPGSRPSPWKYIFQEVLTARKGFLAYVPLILALFALLTAAKVETFFSNPDMLRYECYATAFWFGAQTTHLLPAAQCQFIPQISQYHTLPLEYPPLTIVFFSLPLLVPAIDYPIMFAIFMAMAVSIIYWLLIRYGPRGAGTFFAVCLVAGCLATTLARFDIIPAAFTLLCLVLAESKRWTLAYIALALGVLTKLYPMVLFPILFLAEQRERGGFFFPDVSVTLKEAPAIIVKTIRNMHNWCWKNALIFIGLVVGVTAFFGVLMLNGTFGSFSYLYLRPFQVESLGSVVLWLGSLIGVPIDWIFSFGSWNTLSPIAGAASEIFVILLYLGFIYIVIQQWKGKMDLVQASMAALLVLIATSKIFSPQYLLWLIPILAFSSTSNRKVWFLWGGISLLTSLIYPIGYAFITNLNDPSLVPGFLPVILVRDILFVFLMGAYLFNFMNMRERSAALKSR